MKVFPPLLFKEWVEYDSKDNPVIKYWGISFCDY
jgi:hypothetical protein